MQKNKNQFGIVNLKASTIKKYWRNFITFLVVAVFVGGAGFVIFKNFHKVQKAATVAVIPTTTPDWWLQKYFKTNVCSNDLCKPDADPDKDGLTNAQEFYYHTDPLDQFTVKDTLNDGQLVAAGFDPSRAGRMTFDQVAAPDNVLGDSLLVGQDFKDIVAQQNDVNLVALPLVTDDQLKVTTDDSQTANDTYVSTLKLTINKYFSQSDLDNIGVILKSGTSSDVDNIKTKSNLLAADLQKMTVPQRMLLYHKYTLAFFQLLPKVLLSDGDPALDNTSPESDTWYSSAQALFADLQKLSAEEQRLNIPSQTTP